MVRQLVVYQDNFRGTYRGISKAYYPKWEGWTYLENYPMDIDKVEQAVLDFYTSRFFYQLRLDLLDNTDIAFILFNFATSHGKKKMVQKIQQVLHSNLDSWELIDELNASDTASIYRLILELIEFYSFIGKLEEAQWLLKVYRGLNL